MNESTGAAGELCWFSLAVFGKVTHTQINVRLILAPQRYMSMNHSEGHILDVHFLNVGFFFFFFCMLVIGSSFLWLEVRNTELFGVRPALIPKSINEVDH